MAKKSSGSRPKPRQAAVPKIDKFEIQRAADVLLEANRVQASRSLLRSAKAELKKRQSAIIKVIKKKP